MKVNQAGSSERRTCGTLTQQSPQTKANNSLTQGQKTQINTALDQQQSSRISTRCKTVIALASLASLSIITYVAYMLFRRDPSPCPCMDSRDWEELCELRPLPQHLQKMCDDILNRESNRKPCLMKNCCD